MVRRITSTGTVVGASALVILATLITPRAAHAQRLLGPAYLAPDGGVTWRAEPITISPAVDAARTMLASARSSADSIRAWRALAADSGLGTFARLRLAPALLAGGDTLGADSAWATVGAARSIWTYEALRGRADLALARGDPQRAEDLLDWVDRDGWPDLDRVSWLVRRSELRAMLGDLPQATEFARQAIRRYPSLVPATRALRNLEQWMTSQGQPLAAEDERAAAEVEFFRPDRNAAALRLARAERGLTAGARSAAALRRAEILRLARRYRDARGALDSAAQADSGEERAALIRIERARVFRDSNLPDSAFAEWRRAVAQAVDDAQRETAWWDVTREAEESERWDIAREGAEHVAHLDGRRWADGALRAGIHRLHDHDLDSALIAWRGVPGDGPAFWRAVVLRAARTQGWGPGSVVAESLARNEGGSDSLMRSLARAPGYGFYRMAARESLGMIGWTGQLEPPAGRLEPAVWLAEQLSALGAVDDGLRVLERWAQGDPRLASVKVPHAANSTAARSVANATGPGSSRPGHDSAAADPRWRQMLAAARIAFGAGRWATGIRHARAAFEVLPDSDSDARWGVMPWSHPPAFDSLFAPDHDWAAPWTLPGTPPLSDSERRVTPDRALVYGVAWQESRFDPHARSRSDALGLMQLKLATAAEQARLLRLPPPGERGLFDPGLNLRLGSGYLGRLMRRFDNRATIGLAAYNAGATPARRWARMPDPGGEALACELIGYGQAHDYVKTILGIRQAMREMRPRRE